MATKTRRLADLLANIDDNSKVTSAGLLDATITATDLADDSVGAAEIIDDAVTDAAIADGAINTAAKLGSNVVTTAKILDSNITTAKIASSAVTAPKMGDVIEVKPHIIPDVLYPAVANIMVDGSTALSAVTTGPNSSTVASSKYGTVQSDGRMYYYTDIKGSKPIKDPRIGAHFGSQRHKFKSLQLLEQETAAHNENVYSIDGRAWARFINVDFSNPPMHNDSNGSYFQMQSSSSKTSILEITGYFNEMNIVGMVKTNGAAGNVDTTNPLDYHLNGGSDLGSLSFKMTVSGGSAPLSGRWVDAASVANVPSLNATLGINTVKFVVPTSKYFNPFGVELIAHDKFTDATCDTNHTTGLGTPVSTSKITMTSTAALSAGLSVTGTGIAAGTTVSSIESSTVAVLSAATTATNTNTTLTFGGNQISIPTQNVVSYGKKFSVSAASHHYNPFAFKTDGTTAWTSGNHNSTAWPIGTGSSTNIDTATSLGLSAWVSTNYYYPYNGGRVVKWIANDGTIKTSVNMMPPNARSVANSGTLSNGIAKANASIANNTFYPTFEATAVDNSQAEVAKVFNWREFGNGAANGGTGHSTLADFSMLNTGDNIAYTMDDGLTGLAGKSLEIAGGPVPPTISWGGTHALHFMFIGTGLSISGSTSTSNDTTSTLAQNLPYGTHILKRIQSDHAIIDGVSLGQSAADPQHYHRSYTIHQPKMPPIPEDAVVIADYMLMADYTKSNGHSAPTISKGLRMINANRDTFNDSAADTMPSLYVEAEYYPYGFVGVHSGTNPSAGNTKCKLPAFGTQMEISSHSHRGDVFVDGVDLANTPSGTGATSLLTQDTASTLGTHVFESRNSSSNHNVTTLRIVTPIHTSSHYQEFEDPFLKSLVGGDRNMEQTNLVVSSDGKTWDEVTRDTSYIGNLVLSVSGDTLSTVHSSVIVLDECRGHNTYNTSANVAGNPLMNKDFAIAYDRFVCLKAGTYYLKARCKSSGVSTGDHAPIFLSKKNTAEDIIYTGNVGDSTNSSIWALSEGTIQLEYGDVIRIGGRWGSGGGQRGNFQITRV